VSLPRFEPRSATELSLHQTSRQERRGGRKGGVIREERNENGGGIKLTEKLEDRMDSKKRRKKQGNTKGRRMLFTDILHLKRVNNITDKDRTMKHVGIN
jgi:hypothetical protein